MSRLIHICLTVLLVASHAVAMPWHVALDHAHGLVHVDGQVFVVHTHGPEDHEPAPAGDRPVVDSTENGDPHHHEVQATAAPSSGICRNRVQGSPLVLAVLPPVLHVFAPPAPVLSVEATESPPPATAHLATPALRAPPAC